MKLQLRVISKGGSGSGFHGHAGRPGEVGGSQAENVAQSDNIAGIKGLRVVDTVEEMADGYNGAYHTGYWLSYNGKILDYTDADEQLKDHLSILDALRKTEEGKKFIKDFFGVTKISGSLNGLGNAIIENGGIRVVMFNNIVTAKRDNATLHKLQKLVDDAKIVLDVDAVNGWGSLDTNGLLHGFSYDDFMSAKYVKNPEQGPPELKSVDDIEIVEKEYDSAIIAFDFRDNNYIKSLIEKLGVEGVDDPHITVLFLGDVSKLEKDKDKLLELVKLFAEDHAPIQGKITGAATFLPSESSDDKYPIVLLYDSPQLPFFRTDLHRLVKFVYDTVEQDHGFIPHITLAYVDKPIEVDLEPQEVVLDSISLWFGDEKYSFPLSGNIVEKQLPIDEASKSNLISIRTNIFNNEVDSLAERMYTGEISVGQWEESMKKLTRELHTSTAAIGKGGWDQMTPADWGRLGPVMKEQYRYLHNFAEKIAEERDTISLQTIKARAHMYGNAAHNTAYMIEAGQVLSDKLPWMPGDGSTECLVNCKCRWELETVNKQGDFNIVQATWKLGEAEHCDTCLERDGYIHTLRVYKDISIPSTIGGY